MTAPQLAMKDLRRVVIAAAVGNVIEWYDFYIFGSLATLLATKFFAAGASGSALIKYVGTFTAGFLIRPFGAFLFGRVGDIVGRKYTFLITLSGMGLATALIGFVPSYAQIGALAGVLLLLLRLIQGLCLGGEYGGAITYVAEHAPDEKRGYYTGWLQTSPTLGIVVSLAVIILTREIVGTDAFNAWGWRIPFLLSLLMVAIAIYIRLQLAETPIFQAIKAKGQTATNPWREAFMSTNLKYVVIASIVVIGEGVVWYSGQFWALYFLQQIQKPDVLTRSPSSSGPSHTGSGGGGGLVPVITTPAYRRSHSIGPALVYPIAVPAVAFLLSLFLMPETRKISIWQPSEVRAGARG